MAIATYFSIKKEPNKNKPKRKPKEHSKPSGMDELNFIMLKNVFWLMIFMGFIGGATVNAEYFSTIIIAESIVSLTVFGLSIKVLRTYREKGYAIWGLILSSIRLVSIAVVLLI